MYAELFFSCSIFQHQKTTLMYASENGYLDICQLIIQNQYDLEIDDADWVVLSLFQTEWCRMARLP